MASISAAERALFQPELLEQILILLDTRTLLLAQRTSKIWRRTISRSLSLQKKLFFLPATPEELLTLHIAATLPPSPTDPFILPPQTNPTHPNIPSSTYSILNPLFPTRTRGLEPSRSPNDLTRGPIGVPAEQQTNIYLPSEKTALNIGMAKRIRNPEEGSWKRMLVTQPPNLVCYPRGWANRVFGGTVREILARVSRPMRGKRLFVMVAGWVVDGEGYWDAVGREDAGRKEMQGVEGKEQEVCGEQEDVAMQDADQVEPDFAVEEKPAYQWNGRYWITSVRIVAGPSEEVSPDPGTPAQEMGSEEENERLWTDSDTNSPVDSAFDWAMDIDTSIDLEAFNFEDCQQAIMETATDFPIDPALLSIENSPRLISENEGADLWRESYLDGEPLMPHSGSHPSRSKQAVSPPLFPEQEQMECMDVETIDSGCGEGLDEAWKVYGKDEELWGNSLWDEKKGTWVEWLSELWGEVDAFVEVGGGFEFVKRVQEV